jgi:hypothetical protein
MSLVLVGALLAMAVVSFVPSASATCDPRDPSQTVPCVEDFVVNGGCMVNPLYGTVPKQAEYQCW